MPHKLTLHVASVQQCTAGALAMIREVALFSGPAPEIHFAVLRRSLVCPNQGVIGWREVQCEYTQEAATRQGRLCPGRLELFVAPVFRALQYFPPSTTSRYPPYLTMPVATPQDQPSVKRGQYRLPIEALKDEKKLKAQLISINSGFDLTYLVTEAVPVPGLGSIVLMAKGVNKCWWMMLWSLIVCFSGLGLR